jgi:hypothetical protein
MKVEEGPLRTYLQGHLAGSHAGESVASRLREQTDDLETTEFLDRFIQEIREERAVLEDILDDVGNETLLRRGLDIAAEVVGKAGRIAASASPGSFAELEALAVGVWSKRLLWGTIKRLAEVEATFGRVPVDELSDRAEQQERELLRLRQSAIVLELVPSA